MFSFGHVKLKVHSGYLNGDVEYVVCSEFMGEVWDGNTNLDVGGKTGFSLLEEHKIWCIV